MYKTLAFLWLSVYNDNKQYANGGVSKWHM